MRAKSRIIELLSKDGLTFPKLDNLFSFINKTYSIDLNEIKSDFNSLLTEGKIFEVRKGKYITIPSKNYYSATFIGNSKGFGFCQIDGMEEDIFIPANLTNGAIDGDKVIFKLDKSSSETQEGKIVNIFKPVKMIAGCVEKIGSTYFLEPDNNRIPFKIKLNRSKTGIAKDDKVVVNLIRKNGVFSGDIIEHLGKSDDVLACELAIIRDHQLYEVFPEDVENQAQSIPQKISDKQRKGRLDYTNKVIFTIDGEDAKDLDDAVSIERTSSGGYSLGVYIADVGEYVKYDSPLDREAFNRGTSVYFPTNVLPMLPKQLSNGICSLNENEERLTLSVLIELDKDGTVKSHKIEESIIKSVARLNYTNVYKVLCGEKADEKTEKVKNELLLMNELSRILEEKELASGSLDFEIPEVQFIFDKDGRAVDFAKRERNDAHRLIENFMILANKVVAKEFYDKDIPFVYRVHLAPKKEKVENVIEYLKGLGVKTPSIPQQITPKFYQELLASVEDLELSETINKVILRSMQKAIYQNQCLGHFGLALDYYCHFTSPIRRYPDLTIHRIIKETLHKKIEGQRISELETFTFEASAQSSLTEKNADKCEREVDDLWKAYLMRDRVGEEFVGLVGSVTNFGVFVELENTVEGMIKIEDLDDNFLLFERQLKLKGQRMSFSVGDKIKVRLTSANIYTRKIDFEYIEHIKQQSLTKY